MTITAGSGAASGLSAGVGAPSVLAADRRWCHRALPAVSRTFALNIRMLGGSMGEAVRIAYLLCRTADTIEDAWPGDRAEIERRFGQLLAALDADAAAAQALAGSSATIAGRAGEAHVELVAHLPVVLRCFRALPPEDRDAIAETVRVMASGMCRYAARAAERGASGQAGAGLVPYIDDEAELRDYCWIVAGCIGVMLTRLFSRRARAPRDEARRLALAPAVGEGLQLTNILLDWPADLRGGRCHVPASWLKEAGATTADLAGPPSPAASGLARRLEALALRALEHVPEYVETVPSRFVRYRQFCLWPALWALASLDHARACPGFPTGPTRPKLPRPRLTEAATAAIVTGHSRAGVRVLFRRFRPVS